MNGRNRVTALFQDIREARGRLSHHDFAPDIDGVHGEAGGSSSLASMRVSRDVIANGGQRQFREGGRIIENFAAAQRHETGSR